MPVAFEAARVIGAQLDVLLVRKIGASGLPELALGAVVEGDAGRDPHTVVNDDPWVQRTVESGSLTPSAGASSTRSCSSSVAAGGAPLPLAGRTVIVVDDGVATGATMRAALEGYAWPVPRK
ncbi:hypothetical protein ACTMU2_37105 [Cupriavidus basilensis]